MSETRVNRGFGLTREGVCVFLCGCVCVCGRELVEIVNFWGGGGSRDLEGKSKQHGPRQEARDQ